MTPRDRKIYEFFENNPIRTLNKFIKTYCGSMLGYGLYRDVYEYKIDTNYVIKIEDTSKGSFSNVIEWRTWNDNEEWKAFSKWLAPSIAIDETGQILVQRRVIHKTIDKYPKVVPNLFTDFKIQNYGWIGKQFVCCDYGGLLVRSRLGMKKAKWWDIESK